MEATTTEEGYDGPMKMQRTPASRPSLNDRMSLELCATSFHLVCLSLLLGPSFVVAPSDRQKGNCRTNDPDREVHPKRNMQSRVIDRKRDCNDYRDKAEEEAERNGGGEHTRDLSDFHLGHAQLA